MPKRNNKFFTVNDINDWRYDGRYRNKESVLVGGSMPGDLVEELNVIKTPPSLKSRSRQKSREDYAGPLDTATLIQAKDKGRNDWEERNENSERSSRKTRKSSLEASRRRKHEEKKNDRLITRNGTRSSREGGRKVGSPTLSLSPVPQEKHNTVNGARNTKKRDRLSGDDSAETSPDTRHVEKYHDRPQSRDGSREVVRPKSSHGRKHQDNGTHASFGMSGVAAVTKRLKRKYQKMPSDMQGQEEIVDLSVDDGDDTLPDGSKSSQVERKPVTTNDGGQEDASFGKATQSHSKEPADEHPSPSPQPSEQKETEPTGDAETNSRFAFPFSSPATVSSTTAEAGSPRTPETPVREEPVEPPSNHSTVAVVGSPWSPGREISVESQSTEIVEATGGCSDSPSRRCPVGGSKSAFDEPKDMTSRTLECIASVHATEVVRGERVDDPHTSTKKNASCSTFSLSKVPKTMRKSSVPSRFGRSKPNKSRGIPFTAGESLSHRRPKSTPPLVYSFSVSAPLSNDPIDEYGNSEDEWNEESPRKRKVDHNLYDSPGDQENGRRKRTRAASAANMTTTIEIADSDEESSSTPSSDDCYSFGAKEAPMIDAATITVGQFVSETQCKFSFDDSRKCFHLEYVKVNPKTKDRKKREHKIDTDDVEELHFNVGDASSEGPESLSFISLRVTPKEANGLSVLSKSYLQETSNEPDTSKSRAKKYITIEPRSESEFHDLLARIRQDDELRMYMESGESLGQKGIRTYAQTLLQHIKRERDRGEGPSRRTRSRKGVNEEIDMDEKILVFPFAGNEKDVDDAATGLKEAAQVVGRPPEPKNSDETNGEPEKAEGDKTKTRNHYLTIRTEDRKRLEPGEFLNDTLIDFWMQWLIRKEDRQTSVVHVFTSHFYSTLSEDGPEAVKSWTARKNINVFTKQLIFVPVNKHLHWSLCVVVNPGAIKVPSQDSDDDSQSSGEDRFPCILFLDSLKAHRKESVANTVRKWLNAEWRRLKDSNEDKPDPFKKSSMPVINPRVPYQDNCWDCGVFVCMYAFALFMNRNKTITVADSKAEGDKKPLQKAVSENRWFDFRMKDIERLRDEMGKLIDNLAGVYKSWTESTREKPDGKRPKTPEGSTQSSSTDASTVEDNFEDEKPTEQPAGASIKQEDGATHLV